MVKKLIPAMILALAALGIGGAAQADETGQNCGTAGPAGEQGVGIFTGPGTCYDEFQDGHGHCEYFVAVVGINCE